MSALLLSLLLPMLPPSLHAIPPEARPYVQQCRNEPTWIRFYAIHRGELNLWNTFIRDGSVPAKSRQRAWQVKVKVGHGTNRKQDDPR